MTNKICPICSGENTLNKTYVPYNVKIGEGEYSHNITNYTCNNCGFEGELDSENDKVIKNTVALARQDCIARILNNFDKKLQFTEIERAFSLPPRTLSKWKNKSKSPSAASTALIRLVNVFPWLVYVGMSDYDTDLSHKIACKEIANRLFVNNNVNGFYVENGKYNVLGIFSETKTINNNDLQSSSGLCK